MLSMTTFTRHSRWERPTRSRVHITPNDLAYFEALFRHGPLPSDILHALVRPAVKQKETTERLMLLYSQPNSYIDRPGQQRECYNANYRPLVASKNERMLQALLDNGRITEEHASWVKEGRHAAGRQYGHRLMVSVISALIELGLRDYPSIRFIPWKEIIDRAPAKTRANKDPFQIPVSISHPFKDKGGRTFISRADTSVSPDNLFGFEYTLPNEDKTYRFFALEADRTVEFARPDLHEPSHLKKFLSYQDISDRKLYRSHWGIPNLMVLTITISPERMQRSMDTLQTLVGDKGSRLFLFQNMPDFATIANRTPKVGTDLLGQKYHRVGVDAFTINQP